MPESDPRGSPFAAAGPSGSWTWDIVRDQLHIDAGFAELYGRAPSAEALPTAAFFQAIHPQDRPRIRIAVAGILAGAEVFSKEFRVVTPWGATRWLHARGQSSLDEQDNPVRFTGLLVDVTERKRAEERLRVAQSAGGIGTFEYNDGFATVSVSGEFCRLLGLVPTDRLAVSTINALCRGQHRLIPEGIDRLPTEAIAQDFLVARGDDGEERWIARRGEIEDESDGGYRMLGAIYDVTEAKRAEQALRELNETLEQRVATEVAEHRQTEEALRQAQKMEVVGQLTGGIAHDFNNLLTIIIGSVDTARRRMDPGADPRLGRALENAMKGAERAAVLTHRLLAFSRRQPLDPRTIDLPRLLAGMSDLLGRTISEAITIGIHVPAGTWPIQADPHQLENALVNLAVNARDAMPQGGTLTIAARNQTIEVERDELLDGDYVAIDVIDDGTGMDAETLAKVFDPFFTTKDVDKGTGLGLSMVYGFARQSGGGVAIRSAPGQGTTVTLHLPRSMASAVEAMETAARSIAAGSLSETILVVEDDDDVRAHTVDSLREIGYRVIEAHDGPTALALLDKQELPVALLITDVVMPRMSGTELAAQAQQRKPGLKVLFTSGYTRDAITSAGHGPAGAELLSKPFTLHTIAERVREILDR